MSEHCLVILRRMPGLDPSVLLLKDGAGWALPRIRSEERRSADVADVNRAVRTSLGLEVSVLRCLADEPGDDTRPRRHLYVLEAHGVEFAPPRGDWVTLADLSAAGRITPGMLGPDESMVRAALEPWLRRSAAPREGAAAPDWCRPGWRDQALAWVAGELALRGLPPVRGIEQVKLWEFSQLLRLSTDGGPL